MPRFYTQTEVRAALRAAACKLAAELPELPDAGMSLSETCYTPAGAIVVEYVPRAAVRVMACAASDSGLSQSDEMAAVQPIPPTPLPRVLNFGEFATELEKRKQAVGLLSDAQRGDVIAAIDVATGQRRTNPTETAIIRVCSKDTPVKGLVIARRIGREYDSYLRGTLAAMIKRGLLRRATNGGGYVLDG